MLLKRCAQLATASSLAVAFTLGTPALSFADEEKTTEVILEEVEEGDPVPLFDENGVPRLDESGTPRKKIRIRVTRPKAGKKGVGFRVDALGGKPLNLHFQKKDSRSPVDSVHRWLMGKLGDSLSNGELDPSAMLKQWFDGGKDVPLADLRDTLKADGWNAEKLEGWAGEQLAKVLPQIMQRFAAGHAMPGRGGAGGFTMGGHGMPGPRGRGRSFTWGGVQSDAGCPICGTGPFTRGLSPNHPRPFNFQARSCGPSMPGHPGHGVQQHGFFGHGPRGHGFAGPMGGQRWFGRRGPPGRGFGGQGFGGHGFQGQGFQGQRFGGHGFMGPMGGWQMFGGHGPHGQMGPQNTHSRTIIMWNDGSGWQRKELPGPMMGGHAFHNRGGQGHGQSHGGMHPNHGPMGGMGMPGHGPMQGGMHPKSGAMKDMPWMQLFRQLQPGQKGPHAFGKMSINGQSIDSESMKMLMELLGGWSMQDGGKEHGSFDLNELKKMLQGMHGAHKAGAQPKVRVKIVGPKGKVRVIEEKREDSIPKSVR